MLEYGIASGDREMIRFAEKGFQFGKSLQTPNSRIEVALAPQKNFSARGQHKISRECGREPVHCRCD